MGLEMKYFILKPKSKFKGDPYAAASRKAMRAFASGIVMENTALANDLLKWANMESDLDRILDNKPVESDTDKTVPLT